MIRYVHHSARILRWIAAALLLRVLIFPGAEPNMADQRGGETSYLPHFATQKPAQLPPRPSTRTLVVPSQPGSTPSTTSKRSSNWNKGGETTKTVPRVWFNGCWSAKDVVPYQWHRVSGPSNFDWSASSERFCIDSPGNRWESELNTTDLRRRGNEVMDFHQSSAADVSGDTVRVHVSSSYVQVIPLRSWDRCGIFVTEHDEVWCVRRGEALDCEGHSVSWCSANPRAECNGDVWVESNWRAIMMRE